MYKVLSIALLFLCLSCSSEKPAEVVSQKPQDAGGSSYSIEITPLDVTRGSLLYAVPHGFTAADAKIEWLVNGSPVVSPVPTQFNVNEAKKNDKVQAKAIIEGKELLSNVVQIRNSLPGISSVKIMPEVFKSGDTLYVDAKGSDPDGDSVELTYEWSRNGEPAGSGKQINGPVKRGDKVDIKITPFDGEAYGQPAVLHREILNFPPVIVEHKTFHLDRLLYTYQITATDPDGDTLAYSLRSAPSGMTVNPSTGLVKWNVPPNFRGKASFVVSVTDGHGGEATQNLAVEINPAQ